MKLNKIILTLSFLLMVLSISAQSPGRERIKTLKVAYLTEELNLSSKDAQKFWPVYNAHEEKIEKLRKQERTQFGSRFADLSSITDKEAEQLLSKFVKMQGEKRKIEGEYFNSLKDVISAKQIMILFKAENNFKKRLLQQYRKRRN